MNLNISKEGQRMVEALLEYFVALHNEEIVDAATTNFLSWKAKETALDYQQWAWQDQWSNVDPFNPLKHTRAAENLIVVFNLYFQAMRRNECDYDLMEKEGIYTNLLMGFRKYQYEVK